MIPIGQASTAGNLTFKSTATIVAKEGISMGAGAGAQKITTDVTGNDTAGMVAGMVASGVTAKGLNGIEAEANKLAKAPKGIDGVTEGAGNLAEDVGKAGKGLEGAAKGAESAAEDAGKVVESGSSSIVEIVDEEKGTFIIKDWSDYPDDYVPVPDQNKVWTFLEGDEYNSARDSANIFNRNMRAADPYYANNGLEIHEIEPVKMGGSPTDINNKTAIQSQVHRRYVTPWWNKIRDEVKKGLN